MARGDNGSYRCYSSQSKAADLSRDVENRKAALRARAEARLDQAASLVVERIVKN